MELIPAGIAIAVLAVLLWRKERQLDAVLEASERERSRTATAHSETVSDLASANRETIADLCNRIQAPREAVAKSIVRDGEPAPLPSIDYGPWTPVPDNPEGEGDEV